MKKMFIGVSLLIGISFVFYGFVMAQGKAEKPKKASPPVEASGTALWDHLKKVDYTKWKMWPGKKAFYEGKEPHGALLTTYVNGLARKAIEGKKGTMPTRAVIAMENYSPDKKLMAITVMYKFKGYNSDAGDWFWAKYSPDGKIEAEGKVEKCIKCHGENKAKDYTMKGPLK